MNIVNDYVCSRQLTRAVKRSHRRVDQILIRNAFNGRPMWAVHTRSKRHSDKPPVPDDLQHLTQQHYLSMELTGDHSFRDAYYRHRSHFDWYNYWLTHPPFDGDAERVELCLEEYELSELIGRVDGWNCRLVIEFFHDRWKVIAASDDLSEAAATSTRSAIARLEQLWSAIEEIEDVLHRNRDYPGLRFQALCGRIREWRYHELCLIRHELRCFYRMPVKDVLAFYEARTWGWQSGWIADADTMELITHLWVARERGNESDGSSEESDDLRESDESSEDIEWSD